MKLAELLKLDALPLVRGLTTNEILDHLSKIQELRDQLRVNVLGPSLTEKTSVLWAELEEGSAALLVKLREAIESEE